MWHEYILPPDACLAYPSVAWRPSTSGLRGAGPNGPGAISKRAASVKGRLAADGEVLAIEPGRQVTMTFHPRWLPEIDAEGPVR